jgi:ADP-ribose pyrophosphatase YjhB (NUDIX family)
VTDQMIISSNGDTTFMYRVGAIIVHDGRLLVERNLKDGYCFVPGGRVEYGESSIEALARELREELGEDVEVGRMIIMSDNEFEIHGKRYQEAAPYFLAKLATDSNLLNRQGVFEGHEPGTMFSWLPFDEIDEADLFPPFLRERVQKTPQTTEYIVHSDLESPLA